LESARYAVNIYIEDYDMALRSTGGDGYITLGNSNFPNNSAAKSISFWYSTSAYTGTYGFFNIVSIGSSVATQIGTRSGRLIAWRWGGTSLADSLLTPTVDVTHHCVYTYDGVNSSKIYVDGSLANSASNAETAGAIDSVQFFGNQWLENGVVTLDDFRMYNRALSLEEVETIYSCMGLDDLWYGLVSRWQMKEQSPGTNPAAATDIKDSTISHNHGISFSNSGTDYTYQESEIRYTRKMIR
jgi:hypothetical protein